MIALLMMLLMSPQYPGSFGHCKNCRVEIDYSITYDFGPSSLPGEFRWIVYRKWNGD